MIDDRIARHNTRVLAVAQALGGASPPIVVSLGGIVGQALSPDKGLATLPVSLLQLGLALGTLPAAYVMRRFGRRSGYILGAMVGVLGGTVAAAGIAAGSFLAFCLGTLTAGFYISYVQSYRFAAADSASPAFKPRAISWVMAGGLAAGIIGPQTVIWTRDLIPGSLFAASFLAQGALALLTIPVVACLRPAPATAGAFWSGGRPLSEIVLQPRFLVAVATGVVSFALMSFLMTAAPVAMVECGHSVGTAALGIQWHVLAMFGPSFVTPRLMRRFGTPRVTTAGLLLIGAAAATGLSGLTVANFWLALVLLGVGWNLAFTGATVLVTECYRPEERAKVQAANDFLVFGSVAVASFSSGKLLAVGGWESVNWLVFPPIILVLGLILWQSRRTVPAPA
ncbi:MAG TPA: MFS transporter [Beijerinckiaceae bacterium]|jgi:MFS family permease